MSRVSDAFHEILDVLHVGIDHPVRARVNAIDDPEVAAQLDASVDAAALAAKQAKADDLRAQLAALNVSPPAPTTTPEGE